MNPVQKALWFVEAHSREAIDLERVAAASHVSPFHLARAFASSFGTPIMRYVRKRRLSQAAAQLAAGAPDILTVALDHGYGSHEAFSRAFKDEFGITPESVRTRGHLENLELMEAIPMSGSPTPKLSPPRVETLGPLRVAGIVERYAQPGAGGIPEQWQRLFPFLDAVPERSDGDAWGISSGFDEDGRFDYLCGFVVRNDARLPVGLVAMDLPAQRYAVFAHAGHVAEIRGVIAAVWSEGLPRSGHTAAKGPMLEKYGPEFDPATGTGGFEVWVAIE